MPCTLGPEFLSMLPLSSNQPWPTTCCQLLASNFSLFHDISQTVARTKRAQASVLAFCLHHARHSIQLSHDKKDFREVT